MLQYVTVSKNVMVVAQLPYLERRNLKYSAKELQEKFVNGFPRFLTWKRVSKSEIDLFKSALDLILESNVKMSVVQVKDTYDALEKLKKEFSVGVDRTYVSEKHFVLKDNSLYFVPVDESIVTQLISLVAGIHSYTDKYYELQQTDSDELSAKYQLTDYYYEKRNIRNVIYV